jgi:predicted kinase
MNFLVLMMGIPASGKSTAITNYFPGATIVCPDSHIGYTEDNPWTPQSARRAWAMADDELKEALKRKDDVIVFDATFVKPKTRKKYIRLGNQYGFDVLAFNCSVTVKVAQARNVEREQFRRVPRFIIQNMDKNFVPPTLDEGFKKILTFDSVSNKLKGSLSKEEKAFLGI